MAAVEFLQHVLQSPQQECLAAANRLPHREQRQLGHCVARQRSKPFVRSMSLGQGRRKSGIRLPPRKLASISSQVESPRAWKHRPRKDR